MDPKSRSKSHDSFIFLRGDSTETINVAQFLTEEVTNTGSFDIRGQIWATTFGKVLQSLPIPAFLVDDRRTIVAKDPKVKSRSHLVGKPFTLDFLAAKIREILQAPAGEYGAEIENAGIENSRRTT